MIYRPTAPRALWDSWVFPWKGEHHLFHLETRQSKFDHIGRAVSRDLIRWQPLPSIPIKGKEGEWNHYGALTGTVVRHAGQFHLLVGSIPGDDEVVGVWVSNDLMNWHPDPANPVLRPAGPHYLSERGKAPYWPVDWRDPSVVWNDDDRHFHAVLCARHDHWDADDTGAVLAHVRSKDLRQWEHLPPLAAMKNLFHTEVPDWFQFEGRWYLTFNTLSLGGIQIHTSTRESVTGMFYLAAEEFEGPYVPAEDPFLLGAGQGRQSHYSGRTIPVGDERVVYAHLNGKRPAWGIPKTLRSDAQGGLWLEYRPAIESLESAVVCASISSLPTETHQTPGTWRSEGDRLTGAAHAIGTSRVVATEVRDLHLRVTLRSTSAARAGIVVRGDPAGTGVMVLLDFEYQRMQIGSGAGPKIIGNSIGPFASWNFAAFDSCGMALNQNAEYQLRCLMRDEYVEVYLNDRWVFTASPLLAPAVCDLPETGNVELYVERGSAAFSNLRLAAIEPMS